MLVLWFCTEAIVSGNHAMTPELKSLSIEVLWQKGERTSTVLDAGNFRNVRGRRRDDGGSKYRGLAQGSYALRRKSLLPQSRPLIFSSCKCGGDSRNLVLRFLQARFSMRFRPGRGKLSEMKSASSKCKARFYPIRWPKVLFLHHYWFIFAKLHLFVAWVVC